MKNHPPYPRDVSHGYPRDPWLWPVLIAIIVLCALSGLAIGVIAS